MLQHGLQGRAVESPPLGLGLFYSGFKQPEGGFHRVRRLHQRILPWIGLRLKGDGPSAASKPRLMLWRRPTRCLVYTSSVESRLVVVRSCHELLPPRDTSVVAVTNEKQWSHPRVTVSERSQRISTFVERQSL